MFQAFKEIPREAYYIATKVGRYENNTSEMFNFSKDHVLKKFETSLRLLGLDYVDVIQVINLFP